MKNLIKSMLCLMLICVAITLSGCASWERFVKSVDSDFRGGLDRHIRVMTADGAVIAEFDGKIDLASGESYVLFEYEGKRYIYYNCFVEVVEKK